MMQGRWRRSLLAVVAVTLTLVVPSPPVAAEHEPSSQQIMDAFRDEWGRTDFRETRISDWQVVSTWERAAQFAFAPGTDELTAEPVREADLAALRLVVFSRQAREQVQFQVTEIATNADGSETPNYFPIFRGTPESMVFFNAAGIPGLPAGEVQQRCRALVEAGRQYLACRMIAADGSIRYQVKVPQGSSTERLPSVDEVLGAFRDQWGTDTFRPSGATAWRPVSAWQRLEVFTFPDGATEFDSTPTGGQSLPFRVWLMRRTVDGRPEFQEINRIEVGDGTGRTEAFAFDRFRGGPTDWFWYVDAPPDSPAVGEEIQLHRRLVTIDGEQFLVARVIYAEGEPRFDIGYYALRRITDDPPTQFEAPPE
jgi:hypothetical protein